MDKRKIDKIKQSLKATRLKRSSQECHVYSCKIQFNKLNNIQRQQLKMLFVEAKWFYNHILNIHKLGTKFKDIDSSIKSIIRLDKSNNTINTDLKYLGSSMKQSIVSQMNSNQKTIKSLVKKGFQKYGQLHFIKQFKAIDLKQFNVTHKILSKSKVKIQGINGSIRIKGLKQFDTNNVDIANAKLIKVSNNDYYLNITTYKDKQKLNITNKKTIGIDFGCQNSFSLSNGQKLNIVIEESEKLKTFQRKLNRQIKGSNNYYKTLQKSHKEYSKLQFKKLDATNKIVNKLKNYQHIIIQDEQLNNWKKLGHGKAIQHSILGRVKAKLKALPQTIILDKFIPTSKYCPNCNHVKRVLKQSNRTYKCTNCGYQNDRDINAALNMVNIYQLMKNFVPMGCREFKRADFINILKPTYIYG